MVQIDRGGIKQHKHQIRWKHDPIRLESGHIQQGKDQITEASEMIISPLLFMLLYFQVFVFQQD